MVTAPSYLRKPQQEAFIKVLSDKCSKQLINLPTGVGKTKLAVEIAKEPRFKRSLFLVHTKELLQQAFDSFISSDCKDISDVGVIHDKEDGRNCRFVISTVQTIRNRLKSLDRKHFDLVTFDECHHSSSPSWKEVADYFNPKLRLGLTATPERNDGAPLTDLFDKVTYQMNLKQAVDGGFLVKPIGKQISTGVDLDRVKIKAGDFDNQELSETIDTYQRNNLICDTWLEHRQGRKGIAFCVDIEHAQHVAESMQQAGIKAEAVWGVDPDREQKIKALKNNELEVLTNVKVLTEGFDDPSINAVLLCRPTMSRTLYVQMIGRGLRLSKNKGNCLLLEFTDSSNKHSLFPRWDFEGKKLKNKNGKVTKRDLEFDGEVVEEAKEKAWQLLGMTLLTEKYVEFIDLLNDPPPKIPDPYKGLGSIPWHKDPATEKQLNMLKWLGYDIAETSWSKGQAYAVINKSPATNKQLKELLGYGYDVINHKWTKGHATIALEKAEKAGRGFNPDLIKTISKPRRKVRKISGPTRDWSKPT